MRTLVSSLCISSLSSSVMVLFKSTSDSMFCATSWPGSFPRSPETAKPQKSRSLSMIVPEIETVTTDDHEVLFYWNMRDVQFKLGLVILQNNCTQL